MYAKKKCKICTSYFFFNLKYVTTNIAIEMIVNPPLIPVIMKNVLTLSCVVVKEHNPPINAPKVIANNTIDTINNTLIVFFSIYNRSDFFS